MLLAAMRPVTRFLPALAALLLLGACGRASETVSPAPAPTPGVALSPEEAVRWMEWAWTNRDTMALRELLTDDFEFVFSLGDTSWLPNWNLPDELVATRHLFVGGGVQPPPSRVTLRLYLFPTEPDSRPGRDPNWHKYINATVQMSVEGTTGADWEVSGHAGFYMVRGDSAATDSASAAQDSSRWLIERHEDLGPFGASRSLPSNPPTWGRIKRFYRD